MRMMICRGLALLFLLSWGAALGWTAEARLEEQAPQFRLTDAGGKEHALADYRGKYVVLEWVNFDCPFVHKHYGSGNMQRLQKKYRDKGVVWLSISSSAPGRQGYFEGDALRQRIAKEKAQPTVYLIDGDGRVGMMFGAKATPTMCIINPDGLLIYEGGIDNTPSTDVADIATATNYVEQGLDEALAGKPLAVTSSRSYGCSVKYH